MPRYRHIIFEGASDTERYTAARARSHKFLTPDRQRGPHGARLVGQFTAAIEQRPAGQQVGNGFYTNPGVTLTFESDPNFPLAFESLDLKNSNIQLLSVRDDGEGRTVASIFVPDNKISVLLGKLETYRDFVPGETRGRENKKLAESISNIRLATLRELWTDAPELYPAANTEITWEVWLRSPGKHEAAILERLTESANDFGFVIASNPLTFVDRTVILVRGTREALSRGADLLGIIAEVRKAKVTAAFYSTRRASEQHAIGDELLPRIVAAPAGAPAVGLLDTGVNHAHPLLAPHMRDADVDTLRQEWGPNDYVEGGHGTQMAGLALYGDLTEVLSGDGLVEVTHGVHSLKLIHEPDPHHPDLYGTVTIEGISRLEIDAGRRRIYCMAITADARDQGRPSSWSAAIDNLAFGTINDTRRLIIISAGNTGIDDRVNYPDFNETSSVQDPAQAWNALTVGGYTEKALINVEEWPGWSPLAEHGDLAPSSTTSMTWPANSKVPYKPDIVLEAGNMGRPPAPAVDPDFPPELQLLTTNDRFVGIHRPFVTFHDTSASAALAARMATRLVASYPDFTPETVRGFMVHSARWTDAMLRRATNDFGVKDANRLLRTFGYGAPDEQALFTSANNELTLISQDTIQPFFKDTDGGVKTRDINYHTLPWPRDVLLDLLDTPVELRVTLSYFVEPSPGERGWDRKYGYPSHGLRFKVIRATENIPDFKLRVNAFEREEAPEDQAGETGSWVFGVRGPSAGSVHSNIWNGTAADLANRRVFAIHPTLGWWRTRTGERRFDQRVHYSLIVSVSTPSEDVDIFTPVANQIGILNPIEL